MAGEIVPFRPKKAGEAVCGRPEGHYAPEVYDVLRDTWGYGGPHEIAQMALESIEVEKRADLIKFAKDGQPSPPPKDRGLALVKTPPQKR